MRRVAGMEDDLAFFITFEGIEGCGKTTQMELLSAYLQQGGAEVRCVREPGGTILGERVRELLLNAGDEEPGPLAELFLYEACRAQLVNLAIKPALANGKTVLCDRFIDSTVAYQGYGRGLDVKAIYAANELATGGLRPDLTLILDCAVETGLKRAWSRMEAATDENREDRFEKESLLFHNRVRAGYMAIAKKEPERVQVIDATVEIASIHRAICDIIKKKVLS